MFAYKTHKLMNVTPRAIRGSSCYVVTASQMLKIILSQKRLFFVSNFFVVIFDECKINLRRVSTIAADFIKCVGDLNNRPLNIV